MATGDLTDEDYRTLAGIRYQLRRFLRFSEEAAKAREVVAPPVGAARAAGAD